MPSPVTFDYARMSTAKKNRPPLLSRWFHKLRSRQTPKGFTPIDEFHPEDVFIVGYPKSGNTWFQNLISGLAYGVDSRLSPSLLVNDLVPDVHFNEFYRRYSTPMFFKSHSLPRPEYRRVVYLVRDGRDAMVSYFHYLEAIEKKQLDFLALVKTGLSLLPCKWHEHVEAWNRNPYAAQILVIKYEDLIRQPVHELERFCEFTHIQRERGFLETVADAANFSNLRGKEARLGFGWPDIWPEDKFFFRRGVAGSHKDEMPAEVLAAFMGEAETTLRLNDYLLDHHAEALAVA
ncbi:MAG: Sulfotransferase [Pedosphaera sp.]|nr:Sulfotransferase [Pedosphaera sp.]